MGSRRSHLQIFKIPETLDYMSLLRPPGQDNIERLDASDAEDPENWSSDEVESAIGVVNSAVSRTVQDALDILSKDVFNSAFNLMRHFPNLAKDKQMLVCQMFSMLCNKTHNILQKVPETPYFNRNDASENVMYSNLEYKILSCCPSMETNGKGNLENLVIAPSDMGLILRSLCHVSVFLVCMTLKCATSPPKSDEKQVPTLDFQAHKKSKTSKGTSKRKPQEEGSLNHVALELLIDSMSLLTKSSMDIPFTGGYGGNGHPDNPLLRLLLETLMLALGTRIASFVSAKLVDAISRMFSILFDIMQAQQEMKKSERNGMESNNVMDAPEQETTQADEAEHGEPDSARSTDGSSVYTEWLATLADEIKKVHCTLIADAMELLRDTAIPEVIMTEVLLSIRENFVLQAHGTAGQLMSSAVQAEYTNIGVFIERVTRRLPRTVLSSIHELKQLFDVPSYNLRKSLLESLKSLVIMARNEEATMELETEDETTLQSQKANNDYMSSAAKACARNREALLQILLQRQYDTYMYARASLLKVFQDIIEAEALPIRWYVNIASLALSRLMDKGSQVRQRALNLLTTMIMDATTKRFQLPVNLEDLNRDLDIIKLQLLKLDTIAMINLNLPSGTQGPNFDDQSRKDAVDSSDGQPRNDKEDPLIRKTTLIKELNQELGENIQLDDEDALNSVRAKLELAKEMYTDVHEIAEMVEKSIVITKDMLRSSIETDQRASIKYIATCHLMGVTSASALLPQVWCLAWSNNQNVVDAVLNEFKNVYFENGDDSTIAMRLVKLLAKSRLTEFASIEKIFEVNLAKEQPLFTNLDRVMVALLRIAVAPNYQHGRDMVPRVALGVIRLILSSSSRSKSPQAAAIQTFDEKKLSAIRGLLQLSIDRSPTIFSELCLILTKVSPSTFMEETCDHLLKLFCNTVGSMDDGWFRMAQCVVDVTFLHCQVPETTWSQVLIDMLKNLAPEAKDACSLRHLAQIIFLAGHVAIRTIICMDRLQSNLKEVRAELETFEGSKGENNASSQMGMATSDEQEREVFEQLGERSIVCSNLLGGPLLKLIVQCLHDPKVYITGGIEGENSFSREEIQERSTLSKEQLEKIDNEVTILRTCAAIAICKYATVSKKFCQELFLPQRGVSSTILEVIVSLLLNVRLDPQLDVASIPKEKHCYYYLKEPIGTTLRCTLLICYGDLLCRHPNLLDPWNKEVCEIILDRDDRIRETAVLVFTHLVMNDMVKPKGKLIDGMMYLTLDRHAKIAASAKTFFHEIHKKNPNTIYNCFPEMLVTLASNRRKQSISRNIKIVNMLLKFIRKDKHMESIIEKVCLRLQSTDVTNAMAITIYGIVLLKLNYDERCFKKLLSSIPLMNHIIIESDFMLALLLTICKRVKSSHMGRKGGELDKSSENAEDTAEGVINEVGNAPALTENASLKDLAETMTEKLKALFGEGHPNKVTQIAASAESIVANIEKDQDDADEKSQNESMFIHNFGYISTESLKVLCDDDADVNSYINSQASPATLSVLIKSEPCEHVDHLPLKREHCATISVHSTPCQSPAIGHDSSKLPNVIAHVVGKPAVRRLNEFDSSDEE